MKLRKPTVVQVFALVLVLVAAAAFVLWLECSFLDDWAPNIATGAVGLAITITVVEALLGREGRKRLAPRLDRVFYSLGLGLSIFTSAPVWDYALTHEKTFRRPPRDVSDMLDFWLHEQGTEDTPRDWETDDRPSLLDAGIELVQGAKTTADPDREILEPELVAAIDKLAADVGLCARLYSLSAQGVGSDPQETRRVVREGIVQDVRKYVEVLRRYADERWVQLRDLQLDAAESVHRRASSD